jgi:mRNA interferase MazF
MAAKVRPCLVISVPPGDDERALFTLVPHTTAVRGTRFECSLQVNFLKVGAFDAQGLVTVPKAHMMRSLGRLSQEQLSSVEAKIRGWLGL